MRSKLLAATLVAVLTGVAAGATHSGGTSAGAAAPAGAVASAGAAGPAAQNRSAAPMAAGSLTSSLADYPPAAVVMPANATPRPPTPPEPASTPTPPPEGTPKAPAPPPPRPEPPWTEASTDAIRAEVAAAVAVTHRFWSEQFPGIDGGGWSPTQLWNGDGFYDSAAGTVADCGDGKNYTGNAFFCGGADSGTGFLAWDMQFFDQHRDLGRTMIYMVVAHETGHAVQARLVHDGVPGALFDFSRRYELQADCLGGAAVGQAVRDGYLTLPADASDEMLRVADAFGGDTTGHGGPDQRNEAFQRGFAGADAHVCLDQ